MCDFSKVDPVTEGVRTPSFKANTPLFPIRRSGRTGGVPGGPDGTSGPRWEGVWPNTLLSRQKREGLKDLPRPCTRSVIKQSCPIPHTGVRILSSESEKTPPLSQDPSITNQMDKSIFQNYLLPSSSSLYWYLQDLVSTSTHFPFHCLLSPIEGLTLPFHGQTRFSCTFPLDNLFIMWPPFQYYYLRPLTVFNMVSLQLWCL